MSGRWRPGAEVEREHRQKKNKKQKNSTAQGQRGQRVQQSTLPEFCKEVARPAKDRWKCTQASYLNSMSQTHVSTLRARMMQVSSLVKVMCINYKSLVISYTDSKVSVEADLRLLFVTSQRGFKMSSLPKTTV